MVRRDSSPWAIDHLEVEIMGLVAEALDRGWAPEALVDEIDQLARRGPHAGRIVTSALLSHAGYWTNNPAMIGLLAHVDELAAGFHHLVGQTGPGWLRRYASRASEVGVVLEGVVDVLEVLPALSRPSGNRVDRTASASDVWRLNRRYQVLSRARNGAR
jgi:hypothetical protein